MQTWIFEPQFPVFGRTVSVAGLAGFILAVLVGILLSGIVQSDRVRLLLSRRGLDKNFIAVVTGVLSLAVLITFIVTGLNIAGLPINWDAPIPGLAISLGKLLRLVVLFIAVFWFSSIAKRFLFNRYLTRMGTDRATQYAVTQIIGYLLMVVGFFVVLQNAGIDLSTLTVFAGAVGVGIGFGLQNITSNFISGLVILGERLIKIGDRVEVDGKAGAVTEIRARSTTIVTNDNISIIVPNSRFIEEPITNWTLGDPRVRFRIPVGVAYASNVETVKTTLLAVAHEHSAVLENPEPTVFFDSFGENSLNFELVVWSAEMSSRPRRFRSDLNFAIERKLREAGIAIPFPQREVRLLG